MNVTLSNQSLVKFTPIQELQDANENFEPQVDRDLDVLQPPNSSDIPELVIKQSLVIYFECSKMQIILYL